MKKTLFALIPFLLLTACRKDIDNVDPKNPSSAPASALFTNAQRVFASTVTSSNVNLNIFRLITQYWNETTYTDESNYDLNTRNIPQNLWNTMYRDVLRDFEEAKRLIPSQELDTAVRKNQLAVTDMMEVYTWYYLVTTFGNIPYSEALDINRTAPKYDDQHTIYLDLLSRLNADIASLNTGAGSFGTADVIYNGECGTMEEVRKQPEDQNGNDHCRL
jgi:hypothetical protein